ncbi:MAG: hypothetical protein R3F48_12755 [Candidatus Zixiibacteriota bacterium]
MSRRDDFDPSMKAGLKDVENFNKNRPDRSDSNDQWREIGRSARRAKSKGGVRGWIILIVIAIIVYLALSNQINLESLKNFLN